MSTSVIGVTEGSGKNIWTDQRSVSSTNKEAQFLLGAPPVFPTYTAIAQNILTTTSADHIIFVQGDGTNYCRLKSIYMAQSTLAGAVGTLDFRLMRTSTAGSGGTTVNCRPFVATDTDPFGGTAQTLPSSKGTEGNQLLQWRLGIVAANPMDSRNQFTWKQDVDAEEIIFGVATTSGIAVKVGTGIATVKVDIVLTFVVTSFL